MNDKHFPFLLICLLLISCSKDRTTTHNSLAVVSEEAVMIPEKKVDHSLVHFDKNTSTYKLDDQLYSGYLVSLHANGVLKEKIGILNGRKQNLTEKWHPDGSLQLKSNYHQGKLHGEKKMWLPGSDNTLVAHYNYYKGKAHGMQTQWYPSGEFYKKLHLKMGIEEGIQQAFRKTGELYANYEAKNGRIYGLKKAALCYGLEDEKVNYEL